MNTKMKVLSLALIGAFGYVGAASAACPAGPAIADGGAWSSKTVAADSTMAITTPGLASSACKLSVSVNAGAVANTRALVTDTSPSNEMRYRVRFYLDASALTGLTLGNQQTKIFSTLANASPAGLASEEVTIRLLGGSPAALRFFVGDATAAGGSKTITVPLPTSATNSYRIEFDLQNGSTSSTPAGSFRYWVTDAAAVTTDASPTGTYPIGDNTGWSGAKQTNLGVFTTTAGYRTGTATQALSFDQFDSRRQTFIGQ